VQKHVLFGLQVVSEGVKFKINLNGRYHSKFGGLGSINAIQKF